jgi:hypothetical protein
MQMGWGVEVPIWRFSLKSRERGYIKVLAIKETLRWSRGEQVAS